jgi:DNA-binding SARP family transcriptional activator
MRFAILGPVQAIGADGHIELKAPKQRALLAMLLLSHREGTVSAERLIDVLWDEDPPETVAKGLQVLVSQLRRAMGPDHPIVTEGSGYAIRLEPGELDLDRFDELVGRARRARADGAQGEAAALLREALALFRGPPLADAPLHGPAAAEADRLAGLRLDALEERMDADLAAGEHAALVGELEALVAEHPYR